MRLPQLKSVLVLHTSSFILFLCSGCQVLGVAASMAQSKKIEPKYTNMAGQSAAVMVWADRAIKIEWETIQSDVGSLVQNKLYANPAKEVKETKWPWPSESVVRYQLDHPGIEALPITDVAPKLGVTRLIYVEIERFGTRGEAAGQMFRGHVTATLKVVEITGKTAKIGYEETGITAFFPPKSPSEGVLNSNDTDIYRGTISALAGEIATRLIGKEAD